MTKNSKCWNLDQLKTEATRMIQTYGGCLIEEFIQGKEFTCLVAENAADPRNPHSYVPLMVVFPENEDFKHFNLKYVDYMDLNYEEVKDPKTKANI